MITNKEIIEKFKKDPEKGALLLIDAIKIISEFEAKKSMWLRQRETMGRILDEFYSWSN